MNEAIGDSPSMGRITARSTTMPSTPMASSAAGTAIHNGRPAPTEKAKNK
jgi:hypothetical protein